MLLPILLAGCLASCAAQTTFYPSFAIPDVLPSPSAQPIKATSVLPTSEPKDNVIVILQAAVQSSRELNETTIAPVLNRLYSIIQKLQPGLNFSLTVKNITRV
ncbi:uncharacterized protein AB9X84_000745 [Acanthopagrus schlegelii]